MHDGRNNVDGGGNPSDENNDLVARCLFVSQREIAGSSPPCNFSFTCKRRILGCCGLFQLQASLRHPFRDRAVTGLVIVLF